MRSLLIGVFLVLCAFASASSSAECQIKTDQRRNADGSQVRIRKKQCDDDQFKILWVEIKPQSSAAFTTVLKRTQLLDQIPADGGSLQDIDGDGIYEYVEVMSCGAGPNCRHQIFKIDSQLPKAYLLFDGAYFKFRTISGFYVATGRSSCCSWDHQVYRKPKMNRMISEQDLLYTITVSMDSVDSPVAQCLITKRVGSYWLPTELNDKNLLQLCEVYGDRYGVNPPQS